MEDLLNFKTGSEGEWTADYDDIHFEIRKSEEPSSFSLKVNGKNIHHYIVCKTFEEAKDRAMKFLVW